MRKLRLKYEAHEPLLGHKMSLYGNVYMNVDVSDDIFNTMLAGTLELQARELRDKVASSAALDKVRELEVQVAALSQDKKRKRGKR